MITTTVYLLSLAGALLASILTRIITVLIRYVCRRLLYLITRHIMYPILVRRTRFFPPITRWRFLSTLAYWAGILVCNFIGVILMSDVANRVGVLSTINFVPLVMFRSLGVAADITGISLQMSQFIHGSLAFITLVEVIMHIAV